MGSGLLSKVGGLHIHLLMWLQLHNIRYPVENSVVFFCKRKARPQNILIYMYGI